MSRAIKNKKQISKIAYGYVRVSSQDQAIDGESIKRQEEQIHAYCRLKNIKDIKIISDEGLSGFKPNRPGYRELVQACNEKKTDLVIVYDLSRLSRSVRDTLAFVEDVIQKNEIEFVSLQNDIDTTTPMGKAFLGINAIFNQLYRDEISHKTKAALKHKREKGERTGGIIPFGFKLVGSKRIIPERSEMETLSFMYELRRKGLSLRKIVYELKTNGFKTKTGKSDWHPQVVKQILNKQINLITNDPTTLDEEKDIILSDVVGALLDAEETEIKKEYLA